MSNLYYWVANWGLSRSQAAQLLGGNVADMVDFTSSAIEHVINTSIRRCGCYITGTPDIRFTIEQINRLKAAGKIVLEIDQSNEDLPLISHAKVVKDDESGASTVAESVHVAHERLSRGDDYIIYCSQSWLAAVEQAAAEQGLPHGKIIAYQWASPTSNPDTPLPGTQETLKSANADLSVIIPQYLPIPNSDPHGTFKAEIEVTEHGQWGARGLPSSATLGGPNEWWEFQGGVNRSTGAWRIHGIPAEK